MSLNGFIPYKSFLVSTEKRDSSNQIQAQKKLALYIKKAHNGSILYFLYKEVPIYVPNSILPNYENL